MYEFAQLLSRELDIHICHLSKHWTMTGVNVRQVPLNQIIWCWQCRKGPLHSFKYIGRSRWWKFNTKKNLKKAIVIPFQFSTEWCKSCFENNAVLTPQLDIPHTMNACSLQPFSHCSGTDICLLAYSVRFFSHIL